MTKNSFLLVGLFLLVASCTSEIKDKAINNTKDTIKKIVFNDKKEMKYTVVYSFYKNGEIKEIHRYNNKGQQSGEQLWFYSDGILEKKIPLMNDRAEGNGYFFYDTTGTLSGQRYYRNDNPVFHGTTYWEDSLPMIHSILYLNDSGNIYYKKSFDKNGNFINEEGRKR